MTKAIEYEVRAIGDEHYAVFKDGWELEQAEKANPVFWEGCYIACVGGYENAFKLNADWFHRAGRTKAGNEIGGL